MKTTPLYRLSALMLLAVLTVTGGLGNLSFVQRADAASLTALSDTMSSLKISTASSHTLRFTTPTGAADSSDTIIFTFPSDFNFTSKSISSVSFTHGGVSGTDNTETLAASPSATAWGAVFSGTQNRVLTLTAPSDGTGAAVVAPGAKVVITYDSTNSTNPTVAGTYTIALSGTFGDSGNIMVPVLNDDQVSVTATVAQTLTFSISDNTIGFGTLSSGASRYATGDATGSGTEAEAHQLSVDTNAASGYTTTVKGATLTYGLATIDAIGGTNAAPATGTEQFGIRLTASGGSGTVTAPYEDVGFAYAANASTASEVASSATATSSTTYSVRYLANISSGTEAGAYSTTLTYVTTANF